MTIYLFTGYPNNTDLASTPDVTRETGNSGSIIINADGKGDFAVTTPNSLYTYNSASTNHEFYVRRAVTGGGNFYPCCGRVVDINNLFGARVTGAGNVELIRYIAGATLTLGSVAAGTQAIGDILGIICNGSTISVSWKGSIVISVTDTNHSSATKVGMFARSSTLADYFDRVEVVPILAYTITTANGGNAIPVGASGVVATVAGFANPITSGTLGGNALTITDGVLNDIGFTVSNYVDDTTYYNPSSSQTLSLSDGTNSANLSVPTTVPTGKSVVTLASPNTVDITYPTANLDFTPVDGDKLIYVTADCTIDATGKLTTDEPKETEIIHWRLSDGKTYIYQFTIDEYGVGSNGITARAITAVGITAAGLTVRPM